MRAFRCKVTLPCSTHSQSSDSSSAVTEPCVDCDPCVDTFSVVVATGEIPAS